MRGNIDFRLLTEEAFRGWLINKPQFQQNHFKGYCTLTQNQVEFGPQQVSEHNCSNCFPESHFIMVPADMFRE